MKKRRMQTAIFITVGVAMAGVALIYVVNSVVGPPSSLGVRDGKLAPAPDSPNCVSTQAEDSSHRIEPLQFDGDANQAIRQVQDLLATLPAATVITVDSDYLHAEFRSSVLRFVDDVEFYIDSESKLIDFRSASRIGYSDLGVNRARMEHIRTLFDALTPAGPAPTPGSTAVEDD